MGHQEHSRTHQEPDASVVDEVHQPVPVCEVRQVVLDEGYWMIASRSIFRPHLGSVIRDLLRLLDVVYGIVQKH